MSQCVEIIPSRAPLRESSGVVWAERMPVRRNAFRSSVPAISSQASKSGMIARCRNFSAWVQLRWALGFTHCQNPTASGGRPREQRSCSSPPCPDGSPCGSSSGMVPNCEPVIVTAASTILP